MKRTIKLLTLILSITLLWSFIGYRYTPDSEKTGYELLSVRANAVGEQEAMYRAYKSVVKNQLIQYGKGSIQDDFFSEGTYCLDGLGVVRLIDLDKDGQDELITIGYDENLDRGQHYWVKIFRFDGEKAVSVYMDKLGLDIAPVDFIGKGSCEGFNYYDHGDTFRVLTKNEYDVFYNLTWSELKNNKMVAAETISYQYNPSTGTKDYYIDKKNVSETQYQNKAEEFEKKAVDIQCSGSTVKTLQSVLDETDRVLKKLGCSVTVSQQRNAAYRDKVEELIGKYGKPAVKDSYYGGVAFVRLIDFDDDGNEELYCAYAEQNGYVDQQEIWGFKNGKIISLAKEDINYIGSGTEPFIKFTIEDFKVYALFGNRTVLGNETVNSDNKEIYIGIENGKSILKYDLDDSISYKSSVMLLQFGDELKITQNVMNELGCKDYHIINTTEYNKQVGIYMKYLDEWKKNVGGENTDSIKNKLFFDYDGDGILEMWRESSLESSSRSEKLSLFCTLKDKEIVKDKEVFELINTYESGGHMALSYCETDNKIYMEVFNHAGGFVGTSDSLTGYTMSDGILKKTAEYTVHSYSSGLGGYAFTVSLKNATTEEEKKFENIYHNIDMDTAKKILFDTSYAVSIKEKLKG